MQETQYSNLTLRAEIDENANTKYVEINDDGEVVPPNDNSTKEENQPNEEQNSESAANVPEGFMQGLDNKAPDDIKMEFEQ